ncbi:MAG TPA: hypothetical protein VFF73_37410 [Planctomycetota bacterium]|nr:hypothetical protein [Planctomycetota bacterium]
MSTPDGMSPESASHGLELRLDTLIAALQTTTIATLPVKGQPVKVADLLTRGQGLVKPWKDSRAARLSLSAAVRSKDPEAVREFLADMKDALVATLGRENEGLATFGFKPRRQAAALSSGQKVLRAVRVQETRARNHTMGSQQKAALRVTGSAVMVNPDGTLTAPPASSPVVPAKPNVSTQ